MQKWEYLLVDANMYPFGNKLISLYVNGEEKQDWKQGVLHLFVNELLIGRDMVTALGDVLGA